MDVFEKKEMIMILVCISSLLAVGVVALLIEISVGMISCGVISVYFHNILKCCKNCLKLNPKI